MDIPGLNEQSDITINENQNREETNTNNNEENIKNQSNIETNYYFRQIFPLIKMNIKFSLFIFEAMSYSQENTV